jgi:hypothetical protein
MYVGLIDLPVPSAETSSRQKCGLSPVRPTGKHSQPCVMAPDALGYSKIVVNEKFRKTTRSSAELRAVSLPSAKNILQDLDLFQGFSGTQHNR